MGSGEARETHHQRAGVYSDAPLRGKNPLSATLYRHPMIRQAIAS
jgi:hypothetical protein